MAKPFEVLIDIHNHLLVGTLKEENNETEYLVGVRTSNSMVISR